MIERFSKVAAGVMASWGVTEETHKPIETSYMDFLARLNAHLGRDVAPALLMKQTAPRVQLWKERMNAPETILDALALRTGPDLFRDDEIPETLKDLMVYVAEEYLAEITAHVAYANQWLAERPDLKAGTLAPENPSDRNIGMSEPFKWRGRELRTAVHPYRFWLLQRLQGVEAAADDDERSRIRSLFEETGLGSVFDLKTSRRVERKNNLEVWGPKIEGQF